MRFLRLYKIFVTQRLKMLMEYRVDFLTGATSFLINQITNLVFISIIFTQIPELDGYLYYEIIFIYGFSLVPKGLDHLLTDNLWKVAWFIVRKGDFDKYMTRPISPLLHVIMENVQFDALGELITGIVLVVYASIKLSLDYTFTSMSLMIISMIFGAVIFTNVINFNRSPLKNGDLFFLPLTKIIFQKHLTSRAICAAALATDYI